MFDLKMFVMKTLKEMAKNEAAYKVNRYALGWFEKEVLTVEDLAVIDGVTAIEPEGNEVPDDENIS